MRTAVCCAIRSGVTSPPPRCPTLSQRGARTALGISGCALFVPRCIRSASRRAHTAPLSQRAWHQHGGRVTDLLYRARARCASAILRPLQRPATVLLNSKPPPARRSLSQAARPRALALFKLALPAVRQLAPRNNVTSVTAAGTGRRCNRGWRRRAMQMQEERRRSGPRTSCYGCGRRTRSGRACKCADTCGVS